MKNHVTPLIITFNEIDNIARTIEALKWAKRIVVVDSGSTDGTLEFLALDSRISVYSRTFTTFAEQCNFGLSHIETEWVLSLDADYVLSDPLVEELSILQMDKAIAGYRTRFVYKIFGQQLRGSLYPPRIVLYQASKGRYVDQGHGHALKLDGDIADLRNVTFHDDRKPLRRWLDSQMKYARSEAAYLREADRKNLKPQDKLRLWLWPAPFLVAIYTLLIKGAVFDGVPGWHYTLQRLLAEILLSLELTDRWMSQKNANTNKTD